MNELDTVKVGDWLAFVNTGKATDPVLQQVITITTGLVKTQNYTFRKDGRAFYNHYKSLTARPATADEIDKWLSRDKKQQPETEERKLAQYLTSVDEGKWLALGLPKLKSIVAALRKAQ